MRPNRFLWLWLFLLLAGVVAAEENALDGRAVMERVDTRPRGVDQTSRSTWRLVNASGKERLRTTRSSWRDRRSAGLGLRSQRLIVFEDPSAIRDTAFLVWNQADPEADDTRWIYLPALRKTRRVAGGDRGNSFLGTDFNYQDLSEREVKEDYHTVVGTRELDGVSHTLVESIPVSAEDPYAKRIHWVNPGSWTLSRVEYYDSAGRLDKTLDLSWQEIDGIQVWKRLEMVSENGHRTVVEITEVSLNKDLDDERFSKRALSRGAK